MTPTARAVRSGLTLFELLIVVSLVSVLAGVALVAFEPDRHAALESAGYVVAQDLELIRLTAQQTGSRWTVPFKSSQQGYDFAHSGDGPAPNVFHPQAASRLIHGYHVSLATLSHASMGQYRFSILGLRTAVSHTPLNHIEFQPLGGLGPTRTEDVEVWIGLQSGELQMRLVVSWVTGQVWIDEPVTAAEGLTPGEQSRLARALMD